MSLTDFRTLGRSGLVISPLTLGTMTFGAQRWGSDDTVSRAVFDAYIDAGGNAVDTADVYSGGRSEEMLGAFIAQRSLRDHIVLATKSGFSGQAGNPHAGGNGAKAVHAALEGSLRRLRTDYVDLFWMHVWDTVTPAEEMLQTMGDLVRAGKIRYFGLSNAPAWYVAKLATLASAHGLPGPIALQFQYSLNERGIEKEHVPAAREFGLGVTPWSPLSGGFLAGKYRRVDARSSMAPSLPDMPTDGPEEASTRLSGPNPFGDMMFTERNWAVLDVLRTVAAEVGQSPARVALAWAAGRPGISSVIIGASRPEQITDNVGALDVRLTQDQWETLNAAGGPDAFDLYSIFSPAVNRMVFGGQTVQRWR